MFHTRNDARVRAVGWRLLATLAVALLALSTQALAALTLSPTSASLPKSTYTTVQITGASGTIQASSRNTAVATVTLTNVTSSTATLNVYGKATGSTSITVRDKSSSRSLSVTVTAAPVPAMTVSPTSMSLSAGTTGAITASNASGTVTASSASTAIATVSVSGSTVTVRGVAAGSTVVSVKDSKVTVTVPVTVISGSAAAGTYALIAWNDLGMHCMDGKDYSVFSILPPFNNLHAQLVNASTGKVVTSGVVVTYEAVADPDGSINTSSAGKTNFWTWAPKLYTAGASLTNDVGLTGNYTPSLTAKSMTFNVANGWFEATGLPITPYPDSPAGAKNYYPTVKVVAKDLTGKVLATTTTVLPVSDEITCAACHQSRDSGSDAQLAAKPAAGWVNNADLEKDWKLNILRLHDEKQKVGGVFTTVFANALTAVGLNSTGLYESAIAGKPTLCASCHGSNALETTSQPGVSALTSAQHKSHATVVDPNTNATLDAATNRGACYLCHPGSVTKCLRGAMGDPVDANGNAIMNCQSCHGNLTKVGNPARVGWLEQPNCQACHFDGKRTTSALDANGNLVKPADTRFATNPNVPGTGFSLFRFSKGHGTLQCEACHGSTHAEYPSSHANDNIQSIALQGYEGTIRECTVCHKTVPLTGTGGPHGMHSIGAQWVDKHHDMLGTGTKSCTACHGADYRGSPLAQVQAPRSYKKKSSGTMNYVAGQNVSCYDCHNGPNP